MWGGFSRPSRQGQTGAMTIAKPTAKSMLVGHGLGLSKCPPQSPLDQPASRAGRIPYSRKLSGVTGALAGRSAGGSRANGSGGPSSRHISSSSPPACACAPPGKPDRPAGPGATPRYGPHLPLLPLGLLAGCSSRRHPLGSRRSPALRTTGGRGFRGALIPRACPFGNPSRDSAASLLTP